MAYILERLALTDSEIPVAPFQFTHMSLRDVEQVLRDRVVISRALAARAPYFSNGSAATLRELVDFYDRRFNIRYTEQERIDLVNFLSVL